MSVLTGSIQIAYKTAAQWTAGNVVLLSGQEGHESDTGKRKIGDGTTAWNSLGYIFSGSSGLTIGTSTITSGTNGRVLFNNAGVLGEKAVTGTGDVVLATSPTLVTPDLGTPSAAILTNGTGLPLTTGVTGILPGANGGTGVANTGKTITLGGNLTTTGAFNTSLTQQGSFTIALPRAAGTLPLSSDVGYNVKDYGLVGDGVTDDRAALNTLINTTAAAGSSIYFPPGTYLIGSNISTAKMMHYYGAMGATIKITANTQIFTLTTGAEKSTFKQLKFLGSDAGTSQYAIYFNGCGSWVVEGCYFTDFGQGGIAVDNINASSELGGLITNSKFSSNNFGVNILDVGEYVQITNCDFILNATGIKALGGNGIISGCNVNYNTTTGVEITGSGGSNPGKWIISNSNFNHNTTYSVNIHDVTSGVTVIGCHLVVGGMNIANTTGVNFVGGLINLDTQTINTNVGLCFSDVKFPNTLANTITLTGTAANYFNCKKLDGTLIYANTLAPGTTTVAPIKLTSGTNTTTAQPGAIEYNGTNLFFTRSGTTRESVMTANAVNSVSPTAPNRTITVVIDGTTYYISAKTTND